MKTSGRTFSPPPADPRSHDMQSLSHMLRDEARQGRGVWEDFLLQNVSFLFTKVTLCQIEARSLRFHLAYNTYIIFDH
jgi:hypothetical protein